MLYGVIDIGVEYVNCIGLIGNSVVCMFNLSGMVFLCWGLCGIEDLGGGVKVLFMLELGFVFDSGMSNQGGCLFGWQVWVGLFNNWG